MSAPTRCGCTGAAAVACARWRAEQLAAAPRLSDAQRHEIVAAVISGRAGAR